MLQRRNTLLLPSLALALFAMTSTNAFVVPSSSSPLSSSLPSFSPSIHATTKTKMSATNPGWFQQKQSQLQIHQQSMNMNMSSRKSKFPSTSTSLQMGYNLPPGGGGSGGGGGGPIDQIKELLPIIGTITALTLFFISPLGGIFFAITNSLFVLALLTPFLLAGGLNVWQFFNTIEGACPKCEAPVRVLKDENAGPNVCLSCGSMIRMNVAKDGVELCNDPNDIFDEKSRISSIFDIFTSDPSVYEDRGGGGVGGNNNAGFTATPTDDENTTVFTDNFNPFAKKKDDGRRKKDSSSNTIIDVDVETD